jgi:mono/diheme cytochrome c family protein
MSSWRDDQARRFLGRAVAVVAGTLAGAGAGALQAEEGGAFFKKRISPLLKTHCVECHGPDKQKSHLRVDSLKALLEGGSAGPAVVPGDGGNSLLLTAVSYEEADLQMPPDGKLDESQIADLRRWIEMGAPWP